MNWYCNPSCPFITLSLSFHLGLDHRKCLFLSWFCDWNFVCILISTVRFPCPICPTVTQFTIHHHSVNSTNHAAPHSTIMFIPMLLPLSSHQISLLTSVLAQYFRFDSCEIQIKSHTIEHSYFCVTDTSNLLLLLLILRIRICVIRINICIRYEVF